MPLPATHSIIYHVGVDGGGTGTRARLWHQDGRLLGEGHSAASGLTQGIAPAWRHVGQAIAQAGQTAQAIGLPAPQPGNTALGLGLAGANSPTLRQQFVQANPGFPVLRVESDAQTTLLGAHGLRAGAVLAIGTGSVGLARLTNGSSRYVGGWGFPSGDEGSGAWLGLQAANLAQQQCDGRLTPGPLSNAVLQTCGGTHESLLDWCCQAGQGEFASLAPLVFSCADEDPQSAVLLTQALRCMEQLLNALDPDAELPLAVMGSIGKRLAPRLSPAAQARLMPCRGDAMDGARTLLTL